MQKYVQKGKCKSGRSLTTLLDILGKNFNTRILAQKNMIFNLTSGSPCTAKARETDKHREKRSKRITVKTGKHVIRLERARSISSNDL